jgi:phenylacetate-CoA ligase
VGNFAPKTTGRMQILLDRPGPKAEPPLRVRIEHAQGLGGAELAALKLEIEQAIRARLTVTAAAELVPPGGVARTETKTRLVVVEGGK